MNHNVSLSNLPDCQLAEAVKQGSELAIKEAADRWLRKIEQQPKTIDELVSEICRIGKVTVEEIKGKSRKEEIANVRHVCMWAIRTSNQSLKWRYIGKMFCKNHATAIHAFRKVEDTTKSTNQNLTVLKEEVKKTITRM